MAEPVTTDTALAVINNTEPVLTRPYTKPVRKKTPTQSKYVAANKKIPVVNHLQLNMVALVLAVFVDFCFISRCTDCIWCAWSQKWAQDYSRYERGTAEGQPRPAGCP